MTVTSKPLPDDSKHASWDITRAPIRAQELRPLGVALRLGTGIGMVAYSVITTTIVIGWFLDPVIQGAVSGIHVSYLVGFLFGIGVTAGEWATSADAPKVHWFLVLVLDAPFSALQTFVWLHIVVDARVEAVTPTWTFGLIVVSLLWGIVTANLGEMLLIQKSSSS